MVILSRQVLENLLGLDPASIPPCDPIPSSDPAIVFAYTKLLWCVGAHEEAVSRLCVLKTHVLEPLLRTTDTNTNCAQQLSSSTSVFQFLSPNLLNTNETLDSLDSRQLEIQLINERKELRRLLAKCCLKLGSWYSELYTRSPPSGCGAARTLSKVNSSNNNDTLVENIYSSRSNGVTMRTSIHHSNSLTVGSRESTTIHRNGGVGGSSARMRRTGSTNTTTNTGSGSGTSVALVNDNIAASSISQTWEESQAFVIQCYQTATLHAPECRNTWQSWAMANYAVFNHLDTLKACLERAELELNKAGGGIDSHSSWASRRNFSSSTGIHGPGTNQIQPLNFPAGNMSSNFAALPPPIAELVRAKADLQRCMELHAAPSVRGFVNSISLSPTANLQASSIFFPNFVIFITQKVRI
ncbi:unnamed protein product [Schistosoma turkestanicum]|nr:unnamed protein product [Schistosoma turkestanicum]